MSAPVLVGAVGLAVDVGEWELAHKNLQRAADAAAMSAAIAYQANGSSNNMLTNTAQAVAADYGFANGVTVHNPPTSGANTAQKNAVEVIVTQSQARLLSGLFGSGTVAERGRAVAIASSKACVLALNGTASGAVSVQGSVSVAANGCSIYSNSNNSGAVSAGGSATMSALSIGAVGGISGQSNMTTTAVNGITPNGTTIQDPYYGTSVPSFSGCDQNSFTAKSNETISPGVYCNGFQVNAGANVTMSPGVYFMDQGSFSVNGSATLTGTGVTIIFTSHAPNGNNPDWATATINGGANISLTAPTTGPTAGIVLFGDPRMPAGTSFALAGGASQAFNGATYIPKGKVSYAGGASGYNGCSEVIADTISFSGGSNLAINCSGTGVKPVGSAAKLLE